MKKCPNCNQTFSNDNVFCPDDGTNLLTISKAGDTPPGFPTAGDTPTQVVVTRPITGAQPAASKDSSKWLFLVIGVLATALAGLAIFMFAMREKTEKTENAKIDGNVNQAENILAKNAPQNIVNSPNASVPVSKPIDPNLSPSGNWSGDLAYPSGSTYSAKVDLTEDTNGEIRGKVVWTLLKTRNPEKSGKIGLSATEFVNGTFDKATRIILFNGYNKDDPYNLIILDKYRMTLTENGMQMNGIVYGGKTRWNFNLRRF
jgi:hypothetical protein